MARILITSAIPYINGIKHLGNLVGSQLPADLYARYLRARGDHNPAISEQTMPHYPASSLSDDDARDIYAYILTFEDNPPPVEDIPALQGILDDAAAKE